MRHKTYLKPKPLIIILHDYRSIKSLSPHAFHAFITDGVKIKTDGRATTDDCQTDEDICLIAALKDIRCNDRFW